MAEPEEKLAWHIEDVEKSSRIVILLGNKRFGYAYSPTQNAEDLHKQLDELCLRYNTWTQMWLALKAAERADKHWLQEVKVAVKATGSPSLEAGYSDTPQGDKSPCGQASPTSMDSGVVSEGPNAGRERSGGGDS